MLIWMPRSGHDFSPCAVSEIFRRLRYRWIAKPKKARIADAMSGPMIASASEFSKFSPLPETGSHSSPPLTHFSTKALSLTPAKFLVLCMTRPILAL